MGKKMSPEYRIECLECGAVAYSSVSRDPAFDKEYHRERCAPDAEFEVMVDD